MLRTYGFKGDIVVMDNGTDLPPLSPQERQQAADLICPQAGEWVLLYVGQMNWKKNILHILEACAQLQQEGINFRLVMTGQGPDQAAIQAKASELGLEARTVFTGHILDAGLLRGLYQLADLFVFPSVYDTSSLVLREAAAMETPAVVTLDSCPAEVVRHGENGFLAENTSQDLARVIRLALERDDLQAIGANARSTIPIPWSVVVERALKRYQALIDTCAHVETRSRHELLRARIQKYLTRTKSDAKDE